MKRKLRMKLNRFLVILMSVLMVVYQMPISVMASEEVITESDAFSDSLSGESEDLSQESGNDVGIGDSSTGDVTTGTDIDGSTTISSDDTVDDDTTEGISSGEGDTDVPMFISEIDEDYSISLFSDGEEEEESNNVISVGTYGELLEALDGDDSGDVQENGTIKFTNNITVTKDDITPVDGYYDGIYCTIDTSFTIDFGGYTFTDDGKCINDYVMYFKNTGTKANTITLQNGTVKATGTDAYSTITVGAGSAAYPTTLTLSNMKVENNTAVNGDDVVKVRAGSVANIQNGTVITSNGASAGVNAGSGSTINIYDAQIIQTNSGTTSGNNVYTAITGLGTVNVYDGAVITSDNYGVYMSTSGNAVVNIIGGTITAPTAIYAITNGGDGESVTVNVKGGTIDGKLGEGNAAGEIIISGGTFTGADNVTEFLDENCTVDENGKVTKATSALNGAGTEENPYEISTLEELKFFRNQVNAGNSTYDASGVYVELTASIDLQNENWTPIGTNGDDATRFSGIFNGNGCTISNLYISQEAGYHAAGFFGAIDGTVENLIIDGASVTSLSSGVATVNGTSAAVGSMPYGGTINNVHVKNATINGNRYVAGIVGYAKGTVTNCSIENVTINAVPDNLTGSYDNGDKVGGIVGYCNGDVTITNNTLSGTNSISAYRDVAGVVGCASSTAVISGNTVNGSLTITVDQNINSYGVKAANAGAVVGRDESNVVSEESNTVAESAVVTIDIPVAGLTGAGTVENPYLLNNLEELKWFADDVNNGNSYSGKYVQVVNNIDLGNNEWTPISGFGGVFEGKNEDVTISNLYINQPDNKDVGFFTSLSSTIRNITFKNVEVTGRTDVAAIAGRTGGRGFHAENINVVGTIKITATNNSTNNTGDTYARAGVIVGGWAYGTYENITVDGTSADESYVTYTGDGDGRYCGGIVGHADDVDSYTNCTVKNLKIGGAKSWLCGGIAGPGPADGVVTGCTVENVKINAAYSGGVFGWYYGTGTIEESTVKDVAFVNGSTNNGAIGGYSMAEDVTVKNITIENVTNASESVALLSFEAVRTSGEDTYYYVDLAHAAEEAVSGDIITLYADCFDYVEIPEGVTIEKNGYTYMNESNVVEIYTLDQLKAFRTAVNGGNSFAGKTVKLMASIDLNNEDWMPIGNLSKPFAGTFDGNENTISNLSRNATSSSRMGLFGVVSGKGTVKNLTINNVNLNGKQYVGAVAGDASSECVFENIQITGEINISGYYKVGGLIGGGYFRVSDCHIEGNGTGKITGNYQPLLSDCEGDNIGGLVGFLGEGSYYIKNSSVSGVTITGTRKIGGIVGSAFQNNDIVGSAVSNVIVATTATSEYASENSKTMAIGGIVGLYTANGNNDGAFYNNMVDGVALTNENNVTVSAGYFTGGLRGTETPVEPAETLETYNLAVTGKNTGNTNDYLYEAKIGDVAYVSLKDAVAAAEEAEVEIVLLRNVYLNETIQIAANQNISLDLNGKNITVSYNEETGRSLYAIDNYGTFVLKDSVGTGSIKARGIENFGTMTMNSGKIVSCDSNGGAAIWNESKDSGTATLTINDGTLETLTGAACALYNCSDSNVTINNGTFTANNTGAVFTIISKGSMEINNAAVVGNHGTLAVEGGKAVVNGGSFTSNGITGWTTNTVYVSEGELIINDGAFNGVKAESDADSGAVVCVDQSEGKTAVVTIKNGTFDGGKSSTGDCNLTVYTGTLNVEGGSFSVEVAEKYCAEGYLPTDADEFGRYSVREVVVLEIKVGDGEDADYATLNEALAYAESQTADEIVYKVYGTVTHDGYADSVYPDLSAGRRKVTIEAAEPGAALELTGAYNANINGGGSVLTLDGLTIKDSRSLGSYANSWYWSNITVAASEVNVNNCTFDEVGLITTAPGEITNNTFDVDIEGRYSLWVSGGDNGTVSDITVSGNTFTGTRGVKLYHASEVVVSNNTFDTLTEKEAVVLDGSKATVIGNTVINCKGIVEPIEDESVVTNADTLDGDNTVYNYVAAVGTERYETLQKAIEEVGENEAIVLLKDITLTEDIDLSEKAAMTIDGDGYTLTVEQNVKITGNASSKQTIQDTVLVMKGVEAALTVENLKFTGNSYINASNGSALTVIGCEADVTPDRIIGRAAFIVTGTSELVNPSLLLTVTDSTVIASQGTNENGDGFAAAIFGWRYLADGTTISGNTFGSENTPYNFVAVKFMNAVDNATITVSNNTVYGTTANWYFCGFDLYQNNSRANTYIVNSTENIFMIDETADSSYIAAAFCLEGNTAFANSTNVILLDNGSKVNDTAITLEDIDVSALQDDYSKFYGVSVVKDENGITAGTFGGNVETLNSYCAAGYEGIQIEGTETWNVGVKQDCLISVVSDLRVSVSPSNSVPAFTEVTVKAWPQDGYKFVGWYLDGSEEVLSTSLTYTIPAEKVTGDIKLVAKCEYTGTKTLVVTGEARTYKVNGVLQTMNNYRNTFATYSQITVEAVGENFLYWMNEDGKIMSTSASYTLTLAYDTYLTPVYNTAGEETGIAIVEFVSYQNQVLKAVTYDASSSVTYPTAPSRVGHEFAGWSMTEEEIHAAIADGTTYIRVTPVYNKLTEEHTVTVNYGTLGVEDQIFTGNYGELVTVSAETIEDMTFSHWSSDASGEEVLSYCEKYGVLVRQDITIYAQYVAVDTEIDRVPVVTISDVYATTSDTKLHFAATRSVPEGYTVTNVGVIYTTNSSVGTDMNAFVLDGNVVSSKGDASNNTNAGTYIMNLSMSSEASKEKIVYLRGYVTVVNNSTGVSTTVYSEAAHGSYATVEQIEK